jgi:ATP/maltotriose-dependent transcriptional regulator MalT
MAAAGELERGRACWARGEWREAYELLASARRSGPLRGDDLELLATAAYMRGRDSEYLEQLEHAHHAHLEAGETARATRTAFWLGMQLMLAGETGRGTGWLGRAQRLLERAPGDRVERGYLMLPLAFQREAEGDLDAAAAVARDAAAVAERFGDSDLFALALHLRGHLLVKAGRVADGVVLFDEAMLVVTSDELSPIVCGIVYCGVILGCQDAYEPGRAREWTAALARWCERQPDMVSFSGRCHVHRAEIMHLQGAWSDALEEARRASARAAQGNHRGALAEAAYVQGEVHRLSGRSGPAEEAYREASRYGRDPQPGLALLRVAQGDVDAAAVAIRRALSETSAGPKRARLLPACVEIEIADGDIEAAARACDELAEIAGHDDVGVLGAIAAQMRGAVALATGDPTSALTALRGAWRVWEEIDAPYEAARARELIGKACRALGDEDAAGLELEAARRAFADLGAPVDVERVDALVGAAGGGDGAAGSGGSAGLTPRELEVLRLVACGQTNKEIAAELVLSRRTVDRHVSNIFAKLRVSSRAAATAYAYEHGLV